MRYSSLLRQQDLTLIATLAKLCDWPESLFMELMAYAVLDLPVPKAAMDDFAKHTVLMPQGLNPLTLRRVDRLVQQKQAEREVTAEARAAEQEYQRKWLAWFTPPYRFTDAEVEAVWPARTKMDLALRRSRFRDVWQAYQSTNDLSLLAEVLGRMRQFDYIAVCNFCWAAYLLRGEVNWWDVVSRWEWWDPESWLAIAKPVNDLVKSKAVLAFPRGMLTELGTLLGYRNPPFPGFDVFEEAEDLANGGALHGLSRTALDPHFVSALSVLHMYPHQSAQQSLREYVLGASWATSGASSVGRMDWSSQGKSGHFKARKNLVPDVCDLEKIYAQCVSTTSQENKTVVKAELGKIRLAVSSDLYTYLLMSWLSTFTNHAYKGWPGSTIEETIFQQTERQAQMWTQCSLGRWALPFDFSGFDHQPSTLELQAIFRAMRDSTLPAVLPEHKAEFLAVYDRVIGSMDRSWLYVRDGDRKASFRVMGGLMSGLRWTSLVGNAWNTTVTALVQQYMMSLLNPGPDYRMWIRGDDTAMFCSSWARTLCFRLGYAAVNAVGADGKFAIHRGACEFLRTWYNADGLSGYVLRTIPGLVQRKPWNAAPWEEEGVMEHLYGVVQILRRRWGGDYVERAWSALKTVWSRRKHLSQDWLKVPKPMGFGIEPPDPRLRASARVVQRGGKPVDLKHNSWSADQVLADPLAPVYNVTPDVAAQMADARVLNKASADDIPILSSYFRESTVYNPSARILRRPSYGLPAKLSGWLHGVEQYCLSLQPTGTDHRAASVYDAGSWARYRVLAHELDYAKEAARYSGARRPLEAFETRHADFAADRVVLESWGMSRGAAVGWLLGDLRLPPTRCLHPILSGIVATQTTNLLARALRMPSISRRLETVAATLAGYIEAAVYSSPLSTKLYRW